MKPLSFPLMVTGARRRVALSLAAVVALAGCPSTPVLTPSRSLDRPSDVALVCAQIDNFGSVHVLPLAQCNPTSLYDNYWSSPEPSPRLYLLVTNTTRGELALAGAGTQNPGGVDGGDPLNADAGSAVIDLDPTSPGFGFLPIGALPEPVRTSADGCLAVTAAQGQCDLAVVNVQSLIQRPACRLPGVSGNPACQTPDGGDSSLSALVTRVVPKTPDGTVLGARPSWVEMNPLNAGDADGGAATCPASIDSAGVANGYTALVAFPTCQLVADIELNTGYIKHAVRVTRSGTQVISDLDSIRCQPECAGGGTADGGDPTSTNVGGVTPSDLSASLDDMGAAQEDLGPPAGPDFGLAPDGGLLPLVPDTQALPTTIAVGDYRGAPAFWIGDAASGTITWVTLAADGSFASPQSLSLWGPVGGVERMRLSPRIDGLNVPTLATATFNTGARYLYAIGRDRTVRVVDTDNAMECETNPDPDSVNAYAVSQGVPETTAGSGIPDIISDFRNPVIEQRRTERALRCIPVGDPTIPRDALATSPGITLPGNALPRDIAFVKNDNLPQPQQSVPAPNASPGVLFGWFTFVIDSAGRATGLNVADECPQPNIIDTNLADADTLQACDPSRFGIIPADVLTDFPGGDGNGGPPAFPPFPTALDLMPNRIRNAVQKFLPPTSAADPNGGSRLLDVPTFSIASLGTTSNNAAIALSQAQQTQICNVSPSTTSCNPIMNTSTTTTVTTSPANLAHPFAFRDPPLSAEEAWTISWEGLLPGTQHTTGAVDGNTLTDVSGSYCTRGVHPNDKLYLTGCTGDGDCGPDQTCYFDTLAYVPTVGLCVDRCISPALPNQPSAPCGAGQNGGAIEAVQNGGCQPWSFAVLRYRITSEKQGKLTFDELPLPEHPADTHTCTSDAECGDVQITYQLYSQQTTLPTSCLPTGHGDSQCLRACNPNGQTVNDAGVVVDAGINPESKLCAPGYICAESAVDQRYRCMRAPLPPQGPQKTLCFKELQDYEVHAGEAFVAIGSATGYLHEDYPDSTDPLNANCVQPVESGGMRLLNSRLPVEIDGPHSAAPAGSIPAVCDSTITGNFLASTPDSATYNVCTIPTGGATFLHWDNPIFTMVLDVPQRTVAGAVTNVPDDGTSVSFTLVGGFRPFSFPLGNDIAAQMPRSVVTGPDFNAIYVVDEGTQNVGTGIRGQVLRFFTSSQSNDPSFVVR